jgi:hypothetical protein
VKTRLCRDALSAFALTGVLISAAPAQQSSEEVSAVNPLAEAVVLDWIESPRPTQPLQFVVDDSMEQVADWGQKVLKCHRRTFEVVPPNHLRAESRGDLINRDVIYDGATVTVYDHDRNVYGQESFEGTNSELIDMMQQRHNLSIPLADLLHENRHSILEGVSSGHYLGLSSVNDHECHHVAFTREDIDWQGWFDTQDRARLRRFVVTFKNEPQAPDYTATLVSLSFPESIADDRFQFTPPEGATQIDLPTSPASPEAAAP